VVIIAVVIVAVALSRAWDRWTPVKESGHLEILPNFLVSCNAVVCCNLIKTN
jgi:hypothetical protein